MTPAGRIRWRWAAAAVVAIAATLAAPLWLPAATEVVRMLGSEDWVVGAATRAGPVAIVGLLALAIVVSPVPSGPIAMAAGALYGVLEGGLLAVAGGTLGAIIAFGIARRFGYDAVRRSQNRIVTWLVAPRSEPMLMLIVFASRLAPFISFDAISYAAGLTSLAPWRFVLATVAGVLPASFAFAALGAGVAGGRDWTVIAVVACGVTLIPIALGWLWRTFRRPSLRTPPGGP